MFEGVVPKVLREPEAVLGVRKDARLLWIPCQQEVASIVDGNTSEVRLFGPRMLVLDGQVREDVLRRTPTRLFTVIRFPNHSVLDSLEVVKDFRSSSFGVILNGMSLLKGITAEMMCRLT